MLFFTILLYHIVEVPIYYNIVWAYFEKIFLNSKIQNQTSLRMLYSIKMVSSLSQPLIFYIGRR